MGAYSSSLALETAESQSGNRQPARNTSQIRKPAVGHNEQQEVITIKSLPPELLMQIFESLDIFQRLLIEVVCRKWRAIAIRNAWVYQRQLSLLSHEYVEEYPRHKIRVLYLYRLLAKRCARYLRELHINHLDNRDRFFHLLDRTPFVIHLSLEHLTLSRSQLFDIAKHLDKLKSFSIEDCYLFHNFSAGLTEIFEKCTELELVKVIACDQFFRYTFKKLPAKLKVLYMDRNVNDDLALVRLVQEQCPQIQSLHLYRQETTANGNATPIALLSDIHRFRNLKCLEIPSAEFTEYGEFHTFFPEPDVKHATAHVFAELRVLSLQYVTPLALERICDACKKLEHFGFAYDAIAAQRELGERSFAMLTDLPRLRSLAVVFYEKRTIQDEIANSRFRFDAPAIRSGIVRDTYFSILSKVAAKGQLQHFRTNMPLKTMEAVSFVRNCPRLQQFYFPMRDKGADGLYEWNADFDFIKFCTELEKLRVVQQPNGGPALQMCATFNSTEKPAAHPLIQFLPYPGPPFARPCVKVWVRRNPDQLRGPMKLSHIPEYNVRGLPNDVVQEISLEGLDYDPPKRSFGDTRNREPAADFPTRYCTLLCADSATSTEIALTDQLQSVRQWTCAMAETGGLDKNATEVVDAQTGSTIDPVRQAVDALNNRVVRIMPVVKFPVVFLSPSPPSAPGTKPCAPLPAKAVILRCRLALTVAKVLRPIMAKYNVETDFAVVCIAGTCELVKMQTPVSAVCQKTLVVMSQQQFVERKTLPKREYQKELSLVPQWMVSPGSGSSGSGSGHQSPGIPLEVSFPPFHQHGDVGFCELPVEVETVSSRVGGLLKHTGATRTHSSNPREFFKFGRKPSQAVKGGGARPGASTTVGPEGSGGGSGGGDTSPNESSSSHLRYRKSGGGSTGHRNNANNKDADRRKSLGAAAIAASSAEAGASTSSGGGHMSGGPLLSSAALAVGLVAPSDIHYCGETEPEPPLVPEMRTTYTVPSTVVKHEPLYVTRSAAQSSAAANRAGTSSTTATAYASSSAQFEQMPSTSSCLPEFSRVNESMAGFSFGANGSSSSTPTTFYIPPTIQQPHHLSPIPTLYVSTIGSSEKDAMASSSSSPEHMDDSSGESIWQKADYV